MFRDAITELFETELQGRFTSRARSGMMSVLNYVGGGVNGGWGLLVVFPRGGSNGSMVYRGH